MGKEIKNDADVLIIGAGASGMAAAITAASAGKRVILIEGSKEPGKKILATGNGRCNLTNEKVSPAAYHTDDPRCLQKILEAYPTEKVISFFENMGLEVHDRNGYFYPLSDQAQTVLKILKTRLSELPVKIVSDKVCEGVASLQGKFMAHTYDQDYYGKRLILCCGSRAGGYWKHRVDGYELAKSFSHQVTELYPALMKWNVDPGKEDWASLKGIRVNGAVRVPAGSLKEYRPELEGTETVRDPKGLSFTGELQFTAEGISGIPVFQAGGAVAESLEGGPKEGVTAYLDLLPVISDEEKEIKQYAITRMGRFLSLGIKPEDLTPERFFGGIWNKKILTFLCVRARISEMEAFGADAEEKAEKILKLSKALEIRIVSTAGIHEAQVCRGGVLLSEVDEHMESRRVKGLYLCGEMLNVDGICGGYNLHFAFASGINAGEHAVC